MAKKSAYERNEYYQTIFAKIKNLRLPILTLDQKWYQLFGDKKPKEIQTLETDLNQIVKSQGRIREDIKRISSLKKKLMQEIINHMNAKEGSEEFQKIEKCRNLIVEANDKLVLLENDELDIPEKIREKNSQLALETMEVFYEDIAEDLEDIITIEKRMEEIRNELKELSKKYEEKVRKTRNITNYFDHLLGPDITRMYINYLNGIYYNEDEDET